MRALSLVLAVIVALPLLADAGQGGRRRGHHQQPAQEQTVKTGSDTSNTNVAVPPAPLAEPSYGEVSLICQRARADRADTVDDELCAWGMIEVRERRSPHLCTSWPLWLNRWPVLRHYC